MRRRRKPIRAFTIQARHRALRRRPDSLARHAGAIVLEREHHYVVRLGGVAHRGVAGRDGDRRPHRRGVAHDLSDHQAVGDHDARADGVAVDLGPRALQRRSLVGRATSRMIPTPRA